MKKTSIIALLVLVNSLCKGNSIIIDSFDGHFVFNSTTLTAKGKTCLLFNYLSKDYLTEPQYAELLLRPLISIRVFDGKLITDVSQSNTNALKFTDYYRKTVVPALTEDMKVSISNLHQLNQISSTNTFDTLFLLNGSKYDAYVGLVVIDFFNVVSFHQSNLLQTGRTIFNTDAAIPQISEWIKDSLPIPNVDDMINDKMFLLKKNQQDYTFFRHASTCEDCSLNFYNEFTYRKDFGIVAFKSKYVYRDKKAISPIIESPEYFYFR
jgi:hypothetical protein